MGIVDEGIIRTDIQDEFKLCNVYAKEKCRDCFARFYCSGGCAANSYQFHGRITDAYDIGCEMQKNLPMASLPNTLYQSHSLRVVSPHRVPGSNRY